MSFRFRRSIRLFPGVRLNLSKSGVSTSVKVGSVTKNFGKRGRTTVSLPGTGMSYSVSSSSGHNSRPAPKPGHVQDLGNGVKLFTPVPKGYKPPQEPPTPSDPAARRRTINTIGMIVAGVLAAFCIMGAVIAGVSSVMPDKTPTAVVVKVAPTRLITLTLPGMTDTITPSETALATQTETLIALTATISPRPTDTRWPTATEGQQVVNNPAQAATAADNSGASSGSSQASAPTSAPSGGGGCCKVCKTSKACGDACISAGKTCNKGKGCACQE